MHRGSVSVEGRKLCTGVAINEIQAVVRSGANARTASVFDTTKPCLVCNRIGHTFDECPVLKNEPFLQQAYIKLKSFLKKIDQLQQQATLKMIKANILRLNASSNPPVIDIADTSEEEYADAREKDF